MKRLGLVLVLVSGAAFAQGELSSGGASLSGVTTNTTQTITGAKTFTAATTHAAITGTTLGLSGTLASTVASASSAITVLQGAKLCLNGATCTTYLSDDGTGGGRMVLTAPNPVLGAFQTTSVFTSYVGSGSPAIALTQGAKLDLGGGETISGDGTNININGPLQTTGGTCDALFGNTGQCIKLGDDGTQSRIVNANTYLDFVLNSTAAGFRLGKANVIGATDTVMYLSPLAGTDYGVVETYAGAGTVISTASSGPILFTPLRVEKLRLTTPGVLDFAGIATGSLPTCNSSTNRGGMTYDTTTDKMLVCNGTAWKTLSYDP